MGGGQPVAGRGRLLTLLSVLGAGAEVDYLEQFGAFLFKESALRKQSLPQLQPTPAGQSPGAGTQQQQRAA